MSKTLEVAELLETMRTLASHSLRILVIFTVALTALGTLLDTVGAEAGGYVFLNTIISSVSGFLLLRALVIDEELVEGGVTAGFGSYFAMSLLQGIALIVGFILLVIPGVFLSIRWMASYPVLMVENEGVQAAMKRSWDATEGNFWPIFAPALIGVVIFIGGIALLTFSLGDDVTGPALVLANLMTNLLATAMTAYFTLLGLASYRHLIGSGRELENVFA